MKQYAVYSTVPDHKISCFTGDRTRGIQLDHISQRSNAIMRKQNNTITQQQEYIHLETRVQSSGTGLKFSEPRVQSTGTNNTFIWKEECNTLEARVQPPANNGANVRKSDCTHPEPTLNSNRNQYCTHPETQNDSTKQYPQRKICSQTSANRNKLIVVVPMIMITAAVMTVTCNSSRRHLHKLAMAAASAPSGLLIATGLLDFLKETWSIRLPSWYPLRAAMATRASS